LPEYTDDGAATTVPMELDGYESAFIVFRKPAAQPSSGDADNYPDATHVVPVSGSWQVTFLKPDSTSFTRQLDSLVDWAVQKDTALAYFSGSAYCTNDLPAIGLVDGGRVFLNLGRVVALAKVKVNGQDVGGVWTPPYRLDVTDAWQDEN